MLIAWGFGWATQATAFLRRNLRTINIIGGLVLLVIGLAMATGIWGTVLGNLQSVLGGFVTPI